MIIERFPEIKNLSEDERMSLYHELGHSFLPSDLHYPDERVTDPDTIADLDRRIEEHRLDPGTGSPLPEALDRIFGKPSR